MNRSRFSGIALAAIATLVSLCLGGVKEVGASVGGEFAHGGFHGVYRGQEGVWDGVQYSDIGFWVGSPIHEFDKAHVSFVTMSEDPSEGVVTMAVAGIKHVAPSGRNDFSTHLSMNIGDVYLSQSAEISFEYGSGNFASFGTSISTFNIRHSYFDYHEYVVSDGESTFTRFEFSFTTHGSFGSDAAADERGLPFVPTPGTAFVAGLGVLAIIRRRR